MKRFVFFFTSIFTLSLSYTAQTYKQGEYRTSDGKTFIREEEAKKHQNELDAATLQKAMIGNSEKQSAEKEKQKQKLATNAVSDAAFQQSQRNEKSILVAQEFQKVKNNQPSNPANVNSLTTIFHNYNNSSDYIKAMYVLSVANPLKLPGDFDDVVGRGSLFSSELNEDEKRLVVKSILKNTESTEKFATADAGAERVFQVYCTDSTSFGNDILPKLMTYLKKRSQDYVYRAAANKIKSPAGIKWLSDNGVSIEHDAFKELKENIKQTLKVNDVISEYGQQKPRQVLDQISQSGYKEGSDPEMELLRGIALHRVRKYGEAGRAFSLGWPYYQKHSTELSLAYSTNAMRCLPFDARFSYAAEASLVYLKAVPEWNSLAAYLSMLILDGKQANAESEFKHWTEVIKVKGSKSYSMGTEEDTRELMEACADFYNKKYKKAYKIFNENKWIESENYYYWILYHICAKSIGEKLPSLIVDAKECTKPDWIDQATWDLGKRD